MNENQIGDLIDSLKRQLSLSDDRNEGGIFITQYDAKRVLELLEANAPPEIKTAEEWLNALQEPERAEAIKYVNKHGKEVKYESLPLALTGAFVWEDTKQGHDYWEGIYNRETRRLRKEKL